jgi:hypothetical protein
VRLLDGNSLAGPQLEHDSLPIATGAMAAAGGCAPGGAGQGSPRIAVTRLTQPPSGPGSPWQEVWSGYACGKPVAVQMTFTPDQGDTGTSISASILPSGGQSPAQPGG